jgi:DNA repair protein RadA/Sms
MATTAAKRPSSVYRCAECGWASVKWVGRCGECQAWGTVDEVGAPRAAATTPGPVSSPAVPISDVAGEIAISQPSGVAELDRVLGGGIVPGAVLLLAGEPGVGKSTLLLEVAAQIARRGDTTLYVTGEESASQVRMRAARTGAVEDRLYLAAEVDLGAVLGHIDAVKPELLVIDSVQTIACADVDGNAGGVTQVRAVTAALVRVAKERGLPIMLVGHVTKDGSIAGPRALEHIVDVVLQFEGERNSRLRLLRAVKNRFGPVDEIGCFDLGDDGIVEIADPSGLFLSRHHSPTSGTCVTVTLEGRRPLVSEVQALVADSVLASPRRAVSGLDSARLAMLLAVLERRVGLSLGRYDVYASTVGGVALRGPSADLAVALALASGALQRPIPPGVVALGEVGLAGELRPVPSVGQRLAEAARLGFTTAVVPEHAGPGTVPLPDIGGLEVIEQPDLRSALRAVHLAGADSTRPPDSPSVDRASTGRRLSID